jgi:hypothetical protein
MNQYTEGTAIEIPKTFIVDGEPTDPTDVSFFLRQMPADPVEFENGVSGQVSNPSPGKYVLSIPGTQDPGFYRGWIVGTGDVEASDVFEFEIVPLDSDTSADAQHGPCYPWIDGDAVASMCGAELGVGSDTYLLDQAAYAASELLYMFSGMQYPGECERTARPCGSSGAGCGWASGIALPSASGYGWGVSWRPWLGGMAWIDDNGPVCGCSALDAVELSGYPVKRIIEVEIDGAAVDPATYRLEDSRYLVRVTPDSSDDRLRWPGCQRRELPPGEPGTWTVQYRAGIGPPKSGELAAAELACEIYKLTNNDGDCQLPQQVTSVSRLGITYQVQAFGRWGRQNGQWNTGMPMVDGFLQAFNPTGQRQRSSVFSPDLDDFAHVG